MNMFIGVLFIVSVIAIVASEQFYNESFVEDFKGMSAGYLNEYSRDFEYSNNTEYGAELTQSCSADYTTYGSCTSGGYEGFCGSVSNGCCSSGTTTSNLCTGTSDIKCCTQSSCSASAGSGTCMQTSLCSTKGGTSYSGYCVGPSDLQCCVTTTTATTYGIDVSDVVSSTAASCFVSTYKFIIPRGYRSSGSVDPNICTSLKNAYTAGISVRDLYMFPCPTCSKTASAQISELVTYIKTYCSTQFSGRIWLDIEGSQYWLSTTTLNKSWYQNLVDACTSSGYNCGVYSSYSQWSAIFGSTSYSYGSTLPLW